MLFDFDGTLIDSTPAVKRGIGAACDRLSRPQPDPALLDSAIARGRLMLMGDIARLLAPTATADRRRDLMPPTARPMPTTTPAMHRCSKVCAKY